MKVLWVTNSILPELSIAMDKTPSPFGGWQIGLAKQLTSNGVFLIIATARKDSKNFVHKAGFITYYLLSSTKEKGDYDKSLETQWGKILKEEKPDLIHIHGSEHAHGLAMVKSHPNLNYVLSIQGLISVYARYYKASISNLDIVKSFTLRDILKNDGIWASKAEFTHRGDTIEKEYFKRVNNIIGRTDWDYAHSKALNPSSSYFFCNEALRDSFYEKEKWNLEEVDKYTIFLSQANYPIKGMHFALQAVALAKRKFPNIKLRFAGSDILNTKMKGVNAFKLKGYGKYLKNTITKLNLQDNVEYLGVLSENEMKKTYLSSHVFLCPSSIENSPNSVGEAQILGVPTIASYVGGTPDMVSHEVNGLLYRVQEIEMLAQQIQNLFFNKDLCLKISRNAIETAEKRHHRETICKNTISIYEEIIQQSKKV